MDRINHLHKTEKRWFAIYTKFKCEKFVADHLSRKGIDAYVPLINTTKKYISKVKNYQVPLINCYAFVKINSDEYIHVLETDYVLKFIKQRQDLLSIPDKEILLLKHIVGEYQGQIELVNDPVEKGMKVEIIAGQLTGLNGVVIDNSINNKILVELDNIGVKLRIQFEQKHVRRTVKVG